MFMVIGLDMNLIRIREFEKLAYLDPKVVLAQLRKIELEVAKSNLSPKTRNLRTNILKRDRESREGALFCYGMSGRLGTTVYFSPVEAQDYDLVTRWVSGDCRHFAPVQIKEVVPAHLNQEASIQKTIDALDKYSDSKDLTVVVHLNQVCHFDPGELQVPNLCLAGLWIFGSVSEDQSQWRLWGDFLANVTVTEFSYPTSVKSGPGLDL